MTSCANESGASGTKGPAVGALVPVLAFVLGVLALLINVVGPLAFDAPARAAALAADGVTIVCTAAGPIAVDGKGLPVRGRRAPPICAFCLPLMQGALDPPATSVVLALEDRPRGEAEFVVYVAPDRPLTRSAAHFARGPPAV